MERVIKIARIPLGLLSPLRDAGCCVFRRVEALEIEWWGCHQTDSELRTKGLGSSMSQLKIREGENVIPLVSECSTAVFNGQISY